jgi:hypothetical protein
VIHAGLIPQLRKRPVSALVEGASRDGNVAPAELDYYRSILDIMWDAFGDDRLMYGSNWPVSDRGAAYGSACPGLPPLLASNTYSVSDVAPVDLISFSLMCKSRLPHAGLESTCSKLTTSASDKPQA